MFLIRAGLAFLVVALAGCAVAPGTTSPGTTSPAPTAPAATFRSAEATAALPTSMPSAAPAAPGGSAIRIGLVYPLSGRLAEWGQEVRPFIRAAEQQINALPEAVAAGVYFELLVRSSESTPEGALAAVRDLVENQNVRIIAGLPLSSELSATIGYLNDRGVAVISSASTSPALELRRPDLVYRISPPELYLARTLAELALHLGYTKAAIIHRGHGDVWGEAYTAEIERAFRENGFPVASIPFEPTHPQVQDYAAEVKALAARAAELGADDGLVILLVAWEGEDLNILHHAAADPALSGVRWLSALLYPSLLDGRWEGVDRSDARELAFARQMWGQESRPAMSDRLRALWSEARSELGREPRFEHVYLLDTVQLAARAVLLAETGGGAAIAAAIPTAATGWEWSTGPIRLDANGDRASGDLAYYGLLRVDGGYEYRHFAYYHSAAGEFEILVEPQPRPGTFCPEC